MKNKVRRNLRKNNKFNYRKHRGKKTLKEFLKNCKRIDIEIDKKSFDSQGWVKIKNPFAEAESIEDKIEFSYQPFSIKIKNGDKWNTLTPVYIHGIKENK